MLIEKHEILLKNKKVADVFNSYFDSETDLLDLFSWSTQNDNKNNDALQNILKRFYNHPSLIKIKQLVNNQTKFSCVNEAILSGKFPDSLKLSNIVPVHKKKDPTDKCNYRAVSILPLLSKLF